MEFFFSVFFSLNLFPLFLFDDIVGCCQCFERARFSGIDFDTNRHPFVPQLQSVAFDRSHRWW